MSALHFLNSLAFIVLSISNLCQSSGITSNIYKIYTDVAPTGKAFYSVSSRSPLDCSQSCSKDPQCSMFTIKEIRSVVECETYTCWESTKNTTTPGVNTYTKEVTDSSPYPSGLPLRHESHCYFYNTTYLSPDDARDYCTSVHPGAYMVEVDTAGENDFVRGLVVVPWLGGRNLSGTWTWTHSGRDVYAGYKNWGPGEPAGRGDCMYMAYSTGEWYDWTCDDTAPVVCEYGN